MAIRFPLAFVLGHMIYLTASIMEHFDGILTLVYRPIVGTIVTSTALIVLCLVGSPSLPALLSGNRIQRGPKVGVKSYCSESCGQTHGHGSTFSGDSLLEFATLRRKQLTGIHIAQINDCEYDATILN